MSQNILNCYAVDDEPRAINSLKYIINEYCSDLAALIGDANTTEDAIKYLSNYKPDVLFLDIKIDSRTGFDLLKEIGNYSHLHVIVVTAYNEYAIQAFKYSASNYLLKPINPEELRAALEQISEKVQHSTASNTQNLLSAITDRIFIADTKGWESYALNDIVYFKADNVYTHIYMTNGNINIVSKNLGFVEKSYLLNNTDFIRVHKSFIINKKHILRINKSETGSLVMIDKTEIPISAQIKKDFISQLINFS